MTRKDPQGVSGNTDKGPDTVMAKKAPAAQGVALWRPSAALPSLSDVPASPGGRRLAGCLAKPQQNCSHVTVTRSQALADVMLAFDEPALAKALESRAIVEVTCDDQDLSE